MEQEACAIAGTPVHQPIERRSAPEFRRFVEALEEHAANSMAPTTMPNHRIMAKPQCPMPSSAEAFIPRLVHPITVDPW